MYININFKPRTKHGIDKSQKRTLPKHLLVENGGEKESGESAIDIKPEYQKGYPIAKAML